MHNSENAAAVSADMSRIFEGVMCDPGHPGGLARVEVEARPDLVVAALGPTREDQPRAIFTRLITPAIVVVSLLICIVFAFVHYRQGERPPLHPASPRPAMGNPLALFVIPVPPRGDLQVVSSLQTPPSKTSKGQGDRHVDPTRNRRIASNHGAHPTYRVAHASVRSQPGDCGRGSANNCGYRAFRDADARLRAAYLEAMHSGVSSDLLRDVHHEWREASRQYARRPQATIRRYETLRKELIARRDPSPFVY